MPILRHFKKQLFNFLKLFPSKASISKCHEGGATDSIFQELPNDFNNKRLILNIWLKVIEDSPQWIRKNKKRSLLKGGKPLPAATTWRREEEREDKRLPRTGSICQKLGKWAAARLEKHNLLKSALIFYRNNISKQSILFAFVCFLKLSLFIRCSSF